MLVVLSNVAVLQLDFCSIYFTNSPFAPGARS